MAKPLSDAGFQTNAGVKIPLSITISENNSPGKIPKQTYYNLSIVILFGIVALEHFVLRKKRMSSK